MPKYYERDDTLIAEKIYITFERMKKPVVFHTKGRHGGQSSTINGNPATATISKPMRWKEKK